MAEESERLVSVDESDNTPGEDNEPMNREDADEDATPSVSPDEEEEHDSGARSSETEIAEEAATEDEPPPAEDVPPLDEEVMEKLVDGFLSHMMPNFKKAKQTLTNLCENQRILIETVEQENSKFGECQALTEVLVTMEQAKEYHQKLLTVKKEMAALHEKSGKLKRRALKLQQQKQKEALQKEAAREKELEKERLLIAQPAGAKRRTNSAS